MSERITTAGLWTIGLDLGDKWGEACVVDGAGQTVARLRVATTRKGLAALASYGGARVVVEAGTHGLRMQPPRLVG